MPHSNHSHSALLNNTVPDIPPFPDNVPTAPLLRISLKKLLKADKAEEERCWKACCDLGFFYLDLTTESQVDGKSNPTKAEGDANLASDVDGKVLLNSANQLFEVMKGFYDLPVSERVKYDFKDKGSYFGYKGYGEGIIDAKGTRDRNEFYNISKDDILGLSERLPSPDVLNPHRTLYKSYIESSHGICDLILSLVSSRLALNSSIQSSGGLPALHKLKAVSGDQIRFVKAPPQDQSLKGVALGEHTDFGSVTVLFNRLGGLQVRLPNYIDAIPATKPSDVDDPLTKDGWTYVRPLPGHCIVNLGDALVKFSDGKLRSNIHRVISPPGDQAQETRYSLVYFCRPEDDVVLRSLVEGGTVEEEAVTSKEWILRRALGRRNNGGYGGWAGSAGTEQTSMRVGK